MGEKMVNELGLKPIARLVNCASAGVHPRIMGIGPVEAVPKVLKQAGMNLSQIDLMIFDECHNTSGRNPYCEIMKFYLCPSKKQNDTFANMNADADFEFGTLNRTEAS